jgi:cell division protein FtsL
MASRRGTNRRLKGWTAAIWVAMLSLFIGELLFYTWCRVQCVQAGYAIANESRKQQELRAFQNSLKIELARLKAPENISRIAREQLALGMPDARQIIVVPQP